MEAVIALLITPVAEHSLSWGWVEWLQLNATVAIGALVIDRLFGEFVNRFHPVVLIGNWVSYFERSYYSDSILRGALLSLSTLSLVFIVSTVLLAISFWLPLALQMLLLMTLSSTLLAHRMLHDSVLNVANSKQPQQAVAMLVSRDTSNISKHDAYKAAIETYAENLSDGVVAPFKLLLLFNLPGAALYKAVNTLDSMVGYRTERYEKFGKFSARVDDFFNLLSARLTAFLISLLSGPSNWLKWMLVIKQGAKHLSPNAGYPITALALYCQCRLGGPTYYFGKLHNKPYFGESHHTSQITPEHIEKALQIRGRIDLVLLLICLSILTLSF